jgi:hypothetical protein
MGQHVEGDVPDKVGVARTVLGETLGTKEFVGGEDERRGALVGAHSVQQGDSSPTRRLAGRRLLVAGPRPPAEWDVGTIANACLRPLRGLRFAVIRACLRPLRGLRFAVTTPAEGLRHEGRVSL